MASQLRWTSKSVDLLLRRDQLAELSSRHVPSGVVSSSIEEGTYYAGKRRILKAAATIAHCARVGYISDAIETACRGCHQRQLDRTSFRGELCSFGVSKGQFSELRSTRFRWAVQARLKLERWSCFTPNSPATASSHNLGILIQTNGWMRQATPPRANSIPRRTHPCSCLAC